MSISSWPLRRRGSARSLPRAEWEAIRDEYLAFGEWVRQREQYLAGEPLQPVQWARTVRVQLGGFYLIDAKSLDEAVGIAAKIPGARWGSLEVRPVFDLDAS